MGKSLAVVILAAGIGKRMRSSRPKVLQALAGRPMIGHLMASVARLRPESVVLVIGPGMEAVTEAARQAAPGLAVTPVIQRDRRGTGHAVQLTRKTLAGHRGDVLILLGDGPTVLPETMKRLLAARRNGKAAVAVLGFRTNDPAHYGRMVVAGGALERMVEARDASEAEKQITLCNTGVIAADGALLFDLLSKLRPDNVQRELYLTDIVEIARARGLRCAYAEAPEGEFMAINSRAELATVEKVLQVRLRAAAMDAGATLIDPDTVWFSHDTQLGRDVVVGPCVFFGPGVKIGDGVVIHSFCHLTGAKVAAGATIGPFARLRPGADVRADAHIGNFVELKNARLGDGAKANHFAYIGDARVGAKANVGAGTIVCNYDGYAKHMTEIGPEVFIGSNATLVAPLKIGARAFVAAGSTITETVPADALAFGRARQETKPRKGAALREQLKRAKARKQKG